MNIGEIRRGNRSAATGSRDGAPSLETPPGPMARDAYQASAAPAPSPSVWDRVKSWATGATTWIRNVFDHQDVWTNPAVRSPAAPKGLSVASYNILLGGKDIEKVEANLKELDPDVICLQEADLASTRRLAERLGYHYAFATTAGHPAGKGILSRYPIKSFEDRPFDEVPLWKRIKAYWDDSLSRGDWKAAEPLYQRSILRATLDVGGRTVDVLDTHLSLKHAPSNAAEIRALADVSRDLVSSGHTVIAAGDFNSNFALAGGGEADAPGTVATVTDTVAEFRARYPQSIVGNIGTPEGKQAADSLLGVLASFWDGAALRQVRRGGDLIDPAKALADLQASKESLQGSPDFDARMNVADGISHLSANKRFDNVFVSPDVRIDRALIDQAARGSDHQPVLAEISWR